ncbi:glycosyltransferase family protein [Humibacter ginsengisoli]
MLSATDPLASSVRHIVVVLSWNGKTDTLACVESLVTGSPEVTPLVIDNGSFDGVIEAVNERFPGVVTHQNGRNLGFAGGMNSGIAVAMDHDAEWITVLNNDTIVPAGVFAAMREVAGDDGAASPEIYYLDEPDRLWFAGGAVEDGFPHHLGADELPLCSDGVRITELMAGCCVTASRSTWLRVGMFDERYFLNFEDSEWSMRAHQRSVALRVACNVRIAHSVSASFSGAAATLGTFYYTRNGLLFNRTVGGTYRSRVRFLRRRVLTGIRTQSWKARVRTVIVVGWAIAAYAVGRYGPAPHPLQRLAASWNR